jgi:hypothetical protein
VPTAHNCCQALNDGSIRLLSAGLTFVSYCVCMQLRMCFSAKSLSRRLSRLAAA